MRLQKSGSPHLVLNRLQEGELILSRNSVYNTTSHAKMALKIFL